MCSRNLYYTIRVDAFLRCGSGWGVFYKCFYSPSSYTWWYIRRYNTVFLGGQSNYAGISPGGDPEKVGLPLKKLDGNIKDNTFGGYHHDVAYYKARTGSVHGALFSNKVRGADWKLTKGAFQTMFRSKNPLVWWGSMNMGIAFTGITALKNASYYYDKWNMRYLNL
jgi:hypothetical protein